MRFRTTGILTVLFIVLIGYLYFYEIRVSEERRRVEIASRKVLQVNRERAARMVLRRDGEEVTAEKRGNDWEILKPVETAGDWSTFQALLQAAKDMEIEGVVADSSALARGKVGAADFGLGDPGLVVEIAHAGGETDTFSFGDRSPTGSFVYLQRSGRPEILATSAWQRSQFDKGLAELRDRRMMPFDMDRVQRLEIAYDGQFIVAARQGAGWRLVRPVADRGDDAAISALLNELRLAGVGRFVAEEADDLSVYGLDRPWLRISVYVGEALTEKTVIFGSATRGRRSNEVFAKYLLRAPVLAVDSASAAGLRKTPSDLRYKEIFAFDRNAVDRVRFVRPDRRVDCRRDAGGGGWTVLDPPEHTVYNNEVEALINRVSDLKAGRFVAESLEDPERYGLDRPVLQVEFLKGGETVRRVWLGQKDGRTYARLDGRSQVVEVDPRVLKTLKLPLYVGDPDDTEADTSGAAQAQSLFEMEHASPNGPTPV